LKKDRCCSHKKGLQLNINSSLNLLPPAYDIFNS
jgi:hypothetical protein